jgi:mannosidase alpha-like ER degradation enhancer 1
MAPYSCTPYRRKPEDAHMGNYALTLIESLSTLAVMDETAQFQLGIDWLSTNLRWHNVVVSVFEANIRVLGGINHVHGQALLASQCNASGCWCELTL